MAVHGTVKAEISGDGLVVLVRDSALSKQNNQRHKYVLIDTLADSVPGKQNILQNTFQSFFFSCPINS